LIFRTDTDKHRLTLKIRAYVQVGEKLFKALKVRINIAQGEALGDIKPQFLAL
jgi:hypothetical protein